MVVRNNPVLGYIDCTGGCGDRATVHQAQRGKGRYLYLRCVRCGADQKTGVDFQRKILAETEWLDGPPATLPTNIGDYDPGAEKKPAADLVPKIEAPEKGQGGAIGLILGALGIVAGAALFMFGGRKP